MFGTGLRESATSYEIKNHNISDKKSFDETIKSTFGYFIYQDSKHGNTLLPAIPRITQSIDKNEQTKTKVTDQNSAAQKDAGPLVIEID